MITVRPVSRAPGDPGHDHPRPHVAELRGAIVHSGCYNRTLTPDGFQYERRSYWAVPDVYHAFSPLLFADRLDRPVLIVHGTDDPNPPTQSEQAMDLYRAIVATGGHARLVLLPTKASVPVPRVAPGPRPRTRTMAAPLR